MKSYLKMHKIMTYLKIMMNNSKEEIQAVMMKMNPMRRLLESNILKIYWKKVENGVSSLMSMKK
jgi:hypothetical protein